MTDIRARLADALREELCHWAGLDLDYPEHLADVLLALPAIAVVDRKLLEQLIESTQGLADAANQVADHG